MNRGISFEYLRPRSLAEASAVLLEGGDRAALLAGGTDLLVRLKRSIRKVDVVVDLGGLPELRDVVERPEGLWLGALVTPAELAAHPLARDLFTAVSRAASVVGACQIRQMATVGGALCSGPRCQYRDQSLFWRRTLGPCLASGGERCLATGGERCLATVACDLPPALAALGAVVEVHGPDGLRRSPVEGLYTGSGSYNGRTHLSLGPGEVVTGALLPWPARDRVSTYEKVRLRRAVDRPLVGLAVEAAFDQRGTIGELRIATCGDGPWVRLVEGLEPFVGARLDERVAEAAGRAVRRAFLPTPAVRIDLAWRRHMAGVVARRALIELAARAARSGERALPPGWRSTRPVLKGTR